MKKLLLFFLISWVAATGYAQTPTNLEGWQPNGSVYSINSDNNYIYLGGNFDQMTKSGVSGTYNTGTGINPTGTGNVIPGFPLVEGGNIQVVIADGNGGWYIGGNFKKVGDITRNCLAHINADKSLDMIWNPNPNGSPFFLDYYPIFVSCLVLSGTDLYVGGHFKNIGGITTGMNTHHLAKISALGTGNRDNTWDGGISTSDAYFSYNFVTSLTISGTDLYVGGQFTYMNGIPRNNIAKLSTISPGSINTSINTSWSPNVNGEVRDIVIAGTELYVGGDFTSISGLTRNRVAKISTTGIGVVDANWNPNANASVMKLGILGTDLYVGGDFTSIGGLTRNRIAKVTTLGAGSVDAIWSPNVDNIILSLTISNAELYIGGAFGTINGQYCNRVAKLSTTGVGDVDTNWAPNADGNVRSLSFSGNNLYIGGDFRLIGGVGLRNMARIQKSNMELDLNWKPNPNNTIFDFVVSGTNLYAGGDFTLIGGLARNRVAKISTLGAGNADSSWDPNANGTVRTLALSNTDLYIGGDFTNVSGLTRNRIARINTTSSIDNAWNPNANNIVRSIALSGANLYIGGDFTTVGGITRQRVAKINTAGAGIPDNNWLVYLNNSVRNIVASGTDIYICGAFQPYILKISDMGVLSSLGLDINPSSAIISTMAISGTDLYFNSSSISSIVGQNITTRLAKVSTIGIGNFDINWSYDNSISPLKIFSEGTQLYVGTNNKFLIFDVCSTARLDPITLPNATQGVTYSQTLMPITLMGNMTWSITSGNLPQGLTLNTNTGIISGIAATSGTFNFTIQASNGICTANRAYNNFTVISCPTINISPNPLPNPQQEIPYNQTLTQTGLSGVITWSISEGNLPDGLTLNSNSGLISGIPTTLGTSNFTIRVTNGICSTTLSYNNFSVDCANVCINPLTLSNATHNIIYNQTLIQTGLTGIPMWSVVSGNLPTGLTLNTNSGVISGTPTQVGVSNFTIQVSNGNQNATRVYNNFKVDCPVISISPTSTFSLNSATQGINYNQTLTQTGLIGALTWSVVGGSLPTGLTLNTTTGVISGIPTLLGIWDFDIKVSNGSCDKIISYRGLNVGCAVASIFPGGLSATFNTFYSQTLTTNLPGTLTWSILPETSLPLGLTLNPNSGLISGFVNQISENFVFDVQVTNGQCILTKTYVMSSNCSPGNICIDPIILPNAVQGYPYDHYINQIGIQGSLSWSVINGNLPQGLTMDSNTGKIYGTSNTIGSTDFTVGVSNGTQNATRTYNNFSVVCPNPSFIQQTLMHATKDTYYETTIDLRASTEYKVGTINWSIVNGSLPPGMTLTSLSTSSIKISGTPNTIGTYNFGVQVSNGTCTTTQNYTNFQVIPDIAFLEPTNLYSWYPRGTVMAIASDADYIYWGGAFSSIINDQGVEVQRQGLARIQKSNMQLDMTWNPNPTNTNCIECYVKTLVISGDNLYVGGNFSTMGGQARSNIAKISTTGTGLVQEWNPTPNGDVTQMIISGNHLYIGGSFTVVSTKSRTGLAKIALSTGILDENWNPRVEYISGGTESMVISNNSLYFGGYFKKVNGQARQSIAKLSLDGVGRVDNFWKPNIDCLVGGCRTIINQLAVSGNNLYVYGEFSDINSKTKYNIIRISTLDVGIVDDLWKVSLSYTHSVKMVILGSDLYVGGWFKYIDGYLRQNLAKVSTITGNINILWNVRIKELAFLVSPMVEALASSGDNLNLYVGGTFYAHAPSNNYYKIQNFATFSLCSGQINPDILSNATQNVDYYQNVTQTGIDGIVTWSIIAGSLPNGLTLNASTGELSGIPTVTGVFNFTLRATNGICAIMKEYHNFKVCPTTTLSPNILQNPIIQGLPYTQNFTQTGLNGVITWSIIAGTLPTGITLDSVTGTLSGVPTSIGLFNFTIQVSNGSCTFTKMYNSFEVIPLLPPVAINPTNVTFSDFTANWNTVVGATSYQLDVATDNNFTNFVAGYNSKSVTSNSEVLTGVNFLTNYFYRVRAVNGNLVSANSNVITLTTTPLENTYFSQNTNVYPNPASDKVTISITDQLFRDIKINILDNNGKIVKIIEAENTPQGIQVEINKLSNGIYYFQIESNKMKTIKKVVKQ